MASPCPNTYCCYSSSIPKIPSTATFRWPSYPSNVSGSYGISLQRALTNPRTCAKFEKFQGEYPQEGVDEAMMPSPPSSSTSMELEDSEQQPTQGEEEDDSCLPSDLEGAVRQSSQASATFVSSGGLRAITDESMRVPALVSSSRNLIHMLSWNEAEPVALNMLNKIPKEVELLIPQLQFLDDEGAQAELWELSRVFVDTLIEETGCQSVKAIFPDAGAAALLKYRWQDAAFGFSSLSDRKPVSAEDEIVVMVVPDYQMLEYVQRITSQLSDDPPRPLIMWNPRLISEDVGVGFNVRKLWRSFLSTFTTVYSMRPLPSGAVFRCYPGLWKVFYDDKDRPNRYRLAKELISRPDAEDLEIIYGKVEENTKTGPSFFDTAASIFSSVNRFMKVISR